MIIIKDLIVSYRQNRKIINLLNLSLTENSINGIVGLNGSGKTTLLDTIYGLKKADSGEVKWNGVKLSKKHISYLVTENFFYSSITGREYLGLFKNELFNLDEWNKLFCLPLNQIIDIYSTGMKKKLALLGVLKEDKQIIILDEPFNGIDIEMSRIIRMILLSLRNKGKIIIITSHIIETLTNLCDNIHLLQNGRIRYSRGKDEFVKFELDIFESIENKNAKLIAKLFE